MGGEQTLNFGFAEGDQIIFNFNEVDGKELKVVDISEYPSTPVFSDYKTKEVANKTLNVSHKCVYTFHFSNGALGGRICKIHIQRIPANENTKNFNTSVAWKNINDTTYTEENERYLIKSDTAISNFTDQVVTVHSRTNGEGNKNLINFKLPDNTKTWSYYIGVNESKSGSFASAAGALAQSVAPYAAKIPGYGTMASLALNGVSYFTQLTSGDAVDFYIVDDANANTFRTSGQVSSAYKYGTQVVNSFAKMTSPVSGSYSVCLRNQNIMTPMDVTVKITAITITQQWGTRQIKKMNIVTKNLPVIN